MKIWDDVAQLAKNILGDKASSHRNLSAIDNEIIPDSPTKTSGVFSSDIGELSDIEVIPEYEFILEALKIGCPSLFVTGNAGTGKSTLIRWLVSKLDGCAVVAPTAIAAVSINGETIHSFFGLPPEHIEPEQEYGVSTKAGLVLENINYLVVDEVSMLLPNIVDVMDATLKRVRRSQQPFGGVPTIFVGDLLQLPPVVSSNEESVYFSHRYKSHYFFSARIFKDQPIMPVSLTKVRRQSDLEFINALNRIRTGSDHRDSVALLNRTCYRDKVRVEGGGGVTLVPTNRQAKQVNTKKLNSLSGPMTTYHAQITGKIPAGKWKLPVSDVLELKLGSKVIFLKNKKPKWLNGTMGEVVGLDHDQVRVRKSDSDNVLVVGRETWEKVKYTYNYATQKIEKSVVGTFSQIPLALGWAITIHKSQGMTLEKLALDLGSGAFCEGQAYVALSRSTTLDGITLEKPISMKDVRVDPVVIEFYARLGIAL